MENTCSFENSDEDNTFELDIKEEKEETSIFSNPHEHYHKYLKERIEYDRIYKSSKIKYFFIMFYQISKKFVKNVKENFFNTSLKYIFNTAISFFFINCGIIAFILKKTKVEKIQYSRSMLEFLIKSRFS